MESRGLRVRAQAVVALTMSFLTDQENALAGNQCGLSLSCESMQATTVKLLFCPHGILKKVQKEEFNRSESNRPFTTQELQNPSHDIPELHKV